MKKRVLLGMSGGVDSSVAAILLKEEGYEVIGVTMLLTEQESALCAVEDAKKVCNKLGIQHDILDEREEFKKRVICDFIQCYQQAKTPNPCIECNQYLKFGALYEKAKQLQCDYIATGHYAKIEYKEEFHRYVIKKAKEEKKDQSYFLYRIPKEVLEHLLFPLAEYTSKEEIREIAKRYELEIAEKAESQEICFILNDNYIDFIKQYANIEQEEGFIVLTNGKVLGKHNGIINYTVGQRKGLGIAYPHPLYVIKIDKDKNQIIVGEEKELYKTTVLVSNLCFLVVDTILEPLEVKAKVRYRAKEAKAVISPYRKGVMKVEFEEPQRAITPGQSIVFYQGDIVIGGGKML